MKELIREIKKQNGNDFIKPKDMLWYVVAKVDKIDEKIDKIQTSKVSYKVFFPILGACFTAIGFLFSLVIQKGGA